MHQVDAGKGLNGECERGLSGRLAVDQLRVAGPRQSEGGQPMEARHGDAGGALVGRRVAVDHGAHVEAAAPALHDEGRASRVS